MEEENKSMMEKINNIEDKINDELEKIKQEIKEIKVCKQTEKEMIKKNENKIEEMGDKIRLLQREIEDKLENRRLESDINDEWTKREGKKKKEEKKIVIGTNGKEEEKANRELKWIVEEAEKERKKKNVIITGIEIQDKETLTKWFALKLGIKVGIRKIWKVKNIEKAIGAQLENKEQKIEVMKNKNKLKQEKDKVYINNDFTSQKRDRKKEQERSN